MCALSHFVLCIVNQMCSSHYAILVYEIFIGILYFGLAGGNHYSLIWDFADVGFDYE